MTTKQGNGEAQVEGGTPEAGAVKVGRREALKAAAVAGAAAVVAGTPVAAQAARGKPGTVCSGLQAIESFPLSPLILQPFTEPLPVPRTAKLADTSKWAQQPGPGPGLQDIDGGTHQLWPGQPGTVVANYPQPHVYNFKLRVAPHAYTNSPVRTLAQFRNSAGTIVPAGTVFPRLPPTTIYGFNGTFPGPLINAEYGQPNLIRFENQLGDNPLNLDRGDFGDPEFGFLTHLHNGHTAAESDGNPHHKPEAYQPGDWVDNLYLNYPAGGDDAEKMSFLWFHDHREGHTGANVYKGMAGLYPIYDPILDNGDETHGLRLPGVRTNYADGTFDVDYRIPVVLHDIAIDDGNTPHQDFHNGCGEVRPDQFGKTFFRHMPNHGFVGDVFCVNGKASPVFNVKRRKYRITFLGAGIARQFEVKFMKSATGPVPAVDLGYNGGELQGQYRIEDGVQCMDFVQVATGGGLLPNAIRRDSVEVWPAMRPDIVIDFTRYLDGTPTKKGDVIWLTNIAKMTDGRQMNNNSRSGLDPKYQIPLMKIVIGDDAPDQSVMPAHGAPLRAQPIRPNPATLPQRSFTLQRGGFGGEIQWLINGHPFDLAAPLATVKQGQPEVWTINTGGGWSHPMHFHQEEHFIISRDGVPTPNVPGRPEDTGKDDVITLDPGETVVMIRNFRTFTGKYVAHCHNLAHEDHAMMFGWILSK